MASRRKRRWSLSILHTHTTYTSRDLVDQCVVPHSDIPQWSGLRVGVGFNALFTVPLIPLFTISRTAWASVLFSQPFTTNSCESWNRTPSLLLLPAACMSLFSPGTDSFISDSPHQSRAKGGKGNEKPVLDRGVFRTRWLHCVSAVSRPKGSMFTLEEGWDSRSLLEWHTADHKTHCVWCGSVMSAVGHHNNMHILITSSHRRKWANSQSYHLL